MKKEAKRGDWLFKAFVISFLMTFLYYFLFAVVYAHGLVSPPVCRVLYYVGGLFIAITASIRDLGREELLNIPFNFIIVFILFMFFEHEFFPNW